MDLLEDALREFFSTSENICSEWTDQAKRSGSVFHGLKNLAEQWQIISRCTWNSDLIEKFPNVQNLLKIKIEHGLEDEIFQLTDIRNNMLSLKKKLNVMLELIGKRSYKLDLGGLTSYGEIAPQIGKLIDYAEEVTRCYTALYIEIEYALACLDYKDNKTIASAEVAFLKSVSVDKHVADARELHTCPYNGHFLSGRNELQERTTKHSNKKMEDAEHIAYSTVISL